MIVYNSFNYFECLSRIIYKPRSIPENLEINKNEFRNEGSDLNENFEYTYIICELIINFMVVDIESYIIIGHRMPLRLNASLVCQYIF